MAEAFYIGRDRQSRSRSGRKNTTLQFRVKSVTILTQYAKAKMIHTKDKGMDQKDWQQRRDILICVLCIGIILWAAWNILGQFVDAIVILLLSMAVAFLLSPLVDYLEKRNAPRFLASL